MAWVEDRKVRLYDIEQRAPLRTPGPAWPAAFRQYLVDLETPHLSSLEWAAAPEQEKVQAVRWLLTKALACDYGDAAETYNQVGAANGEHQPEQEEEEEEEEEEVITEAFQARVQALATRLGIPTDLGGSGEMTTTTATVLNTLQAVLSIITMRLSPAALEAAKEGEAAHLTLDDFVLPYSTQDPVVDRVARALTMLYVTDLRELQTDINDILVSAQEFTANPKTNTALGKVGR